MFKAFPHVVNTQLQLGLTGLRQHLYRASIIRNIVSVCLASFFAVLFLLGFFVGCFVFDVSVSVQYTSCAQKHDGVRAEMQSLKGELSSAGAECFSFMGAAGMLTLCRSLLVLKQMILF